jgi:HSP20 family molecular chaperone IbpA
MSTTGQDLSSDRAPARIERSRTARRIVAPYVDVYETEDAFVVTADVPGVAESALEVTVEKDRLSILGRPDTPERNGLRVRLAEFGGHEFQRGFTLPDGVDRDRIEASFKNGVLRLTLPKSESLRPRRISVQNRS